MRILARLRAHLAWLDRRRALLADLPAERIVAEVAFTSQTDDRVRAELAHEVVELNGLIRRHNLVVTAPALHLARATLEGLIETARRPRD